LTFFLKTMLWFNFCKNCSILKKTPFFRLFWRFFSKSWHRSLHRRWIEIWHTFIMCVQKYISGIDVSKNYVHT
jgi:hypothetical protein